MYAQVNRLNVIKNTGEVYQLNAEYEEGQFPASNRIKLNVTKENWGIIVRGFSSGKRKARHLQFDKCGKAKEASLKKIQSLNHVKHLRNIN